MLLEVRNTLVHIVTAVHSTPGARARLRDVDRTHQLRYHAGLHPREDCWTRRLSRLGCLCSHCSEQPTAFPRKGTGVLRVLTGTHPCDTSTQAGWWRYQSASSYVRGYAWWCCRTRGRVCRRWFCGEVLSGFRAPPRTMSLALSFDLGRSRDSTFSNHGSEFVKSASSSTFSLCETLGRIDDSSIVLAPSLVSHVSENPRAPSLHLWTTPPGTSRWFSTRNLLTPSETCLSILPIQAFTLSNDSLSVTL